MSVVVEAAKLAEHKPESLIYIKMNVTEEGMEWSRMQNSQGEVVSKLLPE
jgi:hypothetical protein